MEWYLDVGLVGFVCVGMVVELATGRVPNWLTFAGVLAGLGGGVAMGKLGVHLGGLGLAAGCAIVMWRAGWFEAGSAKFAMAIGAFLGFPRVGVILGFGAVLFLLVNLGYFLWSKFYTRPLSDKGEPEIPAAMAASLQRARETAAELEGAPQSRGIPGTLLWGATVLLLVVPGLFRGLKS